MLSHYELINMESSMEKYGFRDVWITCITTSIISYYVLGSLFLGFWYIIIGLHHDLTQNWQQGINKINDDLNF